MATPGPSARWALRRSVSGACLCVVLSGTSWVTPDRQELRFMPFTALHPDLGRVDATLPDLGGGLAWSQIHKVRPRIPLACPECSWSLHPKVSRYGVRFFCHDPGRPPSCELSNESWEHHMLKLEMAAAIRAAGWYAALEAPAEDGSWRADVLASSVDGKQRMAWEAQLSPISTIRVSVPLPGMPRRITTRRPTKPVRLAAAADSFGDLRSTGGEPETATPSRLPHHSGMGVKPVAQPGTDGAAHPVTSPVMDDHPKAPHGKDNGQSPQSHAEETAAVTDRGSESPTARPGPAPPDGDGLKWRDAWHLPTGRPWTCWTPIWRHCGMRRTPRSRRSRSTSQRKKETSSSVGPWTDSGASRASRRTLSLGKSAAY
ncbi:hypothetical protein QF032_007737 [Streptomyces achromogenes]|nr:hypothetical protein [Streptomyces achromogenes]